MGEVTLINDEIKIYEVSYEYREYLYQFDKRVNLKNNRRFSGIILRINEFHYSIPLTSHPLRKNGQRRNKRTTVEIYNESRELIAALLINNMIPVKKENYHLVDIANDRDKDYLNSEYIYLRKERVKKELIRKVENTFYNVLAKQDNFMKAFCCDFELLEQKCLEYKK